MSPFNDRVNRDTEEGEKSPKEGHYDPSCEKLFRKLVGCAVKTVVLC
jgi:hypothetical protein